MSQLLKDNATGPQGSFAVSTVRTFAGGTPVERPMLSPFSNADYADETPWPFETMVFKEGKGSTGFYHRAYANEDDARRGHAEVVQFCRDGTLPLGQGVKDDIWGNPTLTADEWRNAAR